jgi:hypothetical protein
MAIGEYNRVMERIDKDHEMKDNAQWPFEKSSAILKLKPLYAGEASR